MKKIISFLLVIVFCISLNGCAFLSVLRSETPNSTEQYASTFYNKVSESKILLDRVATDVCAAWRDAASDYTLSTKDVNDAIEEAKQEHSESIAKINSLDTEIRELFTEAKEEAKNFIQEEALKRVMTSYSEYKDSILGANEALDPGGYMSVSFSKGSLDSALQNLFTEL